MSAHTTPNPHDAEEQLRPFFGRLYDLAERMDETLCDDALYAVIEEYVDELQRTVDKACELLGVTR